jgi:UDPglucose--hexose-1-phosphate uridylyltransferase
MIFEANEHPHRRYNPLLDEWVLVSPHRTKRPWQGQNEKLPSAVLPEYDTSCYLCPGNKRSNGEINPDYKATFVFDNDFPALLNEEVTPVSNRHALLQLKPEQGINRVVCFSPRHDLTLPELSISEIKTVVKTWMSEYKNLGSLRHINYVQIFENKGAVMGCSNPHPHGQIWAQSSLPTLIDKTQKQLSRYFQQYNVSLLTDYLRVELEEQERLIYENSHFVVLVPFWAIWPFETLILPKRAMPHIGEMNDEEQEHFAEAIKVLTTKYDNLFETSFPYSAGIHQAPTDGKNHPEWHWHMHFYPPLLRSATVKKFMVGYEMLAEAQRDITAEQSAARLRDLSHIHYKMNPHE